MTILEMVQEWREESQYPPEARSIKVSTWQQDKLLEAISEISEVLLRKYSTPAPTRRMEIILEQLQKELLKKWGMME